MGYTYSLWHGVQEHKTFTKRIFAGVMALLFAGSVVAAISVSADTTETVTGNTVNVAAGESGSTGWWFDRDQNTSTDYSFVNNTPSIGNGSLYVPPIGANSSDKFIAEYFYLNSADDFQSFSYDFNIAGNGTAADANDFYLNVYANLPDTPVENFYECRYNFVPTTGINDSYTTFEVDSSTVAKSVTARGAGVVCPASKTIGELPEGSTIRVFAINVGDTSVNDSGLAGYLDNINISVAGETTTFDFEADAQDPVSEITAPADGAQVAGDVEVRGSVTDENDLLRYYTVVRDSANQVVDGPGTVNVTESFEDELLFSWDTTDDEDGVYTIRLESRDAAGNKGPDSIDVITVTVDNTVPVVGVTNPTEGEELRGVVDLEGTVVDENAVEFRFAVRNSDNDVVFNSRFQDVPADGVVASEFDTTAYPDGDYRVVLTGTDAAGNTSRAVVAFTIDNVVDAKDDCKNGGFVLYGFRNQGQCVASVVSNENSAVRGRN